MANQNKIKIKAFRNAIYQGYLENDKFSKIGALLTEDFLFCLSSWNKGSLDGPTFILF
jgi:hypothetical protein